MSGSLHDEGKWEQEVTELLAAPEYSGHRLRSALDDLFQRYADQISQLEKLTSISDGFHSALRASNQSLNERYRQQIRQLQKIIRISDQYQKMLQEANDRLKIVSSHDALTGLANRRLMQDHLEAAVAISTRHGRPFSLALLDIDHFKRINDEWGHDVGDRALVCFAEELRVSLRPYDVCARWGGEEFLILLAETKGDDAADVANRLREEAASICAPQLPSGVALAVSIGVAEYVRGEKWDKTLKRADEALYRAKHSGRNCVIFAPAPETQVDKSVVSR
jgi:diguanylate cyclase (GGDEF)-like protein